MAVASRNFLSGEKSVSWRTRVTAVITLGFFRGSTLLRLPAFVSRCVVTRPHECGGLNNTTLFSPVGEATVMSVSRGGERGVSRTFFWLLPGPWPRSSLLCVTLASLGRSQALCLPLQEHWCSPWGRIPSPSGILHFASCHVLPAAGSQAAGLRTLAS